MAPDPEDHTGALAPYRVVDLCGELGALCTVMLSGLGAEVIRVEPPGGHATRTKPPLLADGTSLYWSQMNAGKRSVVLNLESTAGREDLRRLAKTADFLIESSTPGAMASLGLGFEDLRAIAPRLIYTSITPFGQEGPKSDWAGPDLIGMAAGGLMSLCGDPDRAPLRVSVEQGFGLAGLAASVGSLIALHARERTGRGQQVDVSMQAAVANALGNARLYYAMEGLVTRRAGGGRAFGKVGTRLIFESSDGHVAFIRVSYTFEALATWFEAEGVPYAFEVERWSQRALAGSQMPDASEVTALEAELIPFFAARSTMELYEEGQRRGLMICPVSNMADLASNPQLQHRKFFGQDSDGVRRPGAPMRMSATPWLRGAAPRLGADTDAVMEQVSGLPLGNGAGGEPPTVDAEWAREIFKGLRVADFSWVGVGPNAAQQLAWHGAEVIRVESTLRTDTFRSSGPLAPNVEGLDRSAYFANHNRDKLAAQINLREPGGVEAAKRLIAQSDIVTESFTPGFMQEVGLDYESVRAVRPDVIMISMSMEGQGGPHEAFRGFGLILQATAGITGLTGWPDRAPVGTGVAYTDWLATHIAAAALLAAVDHRRRTGEGQYIDLSQLEATTYGLDAALLDYLNTGREAAALGNRHLEHAPHGVFPCTGEDRWCAIAVTSDEEWLALCEELGREDWAADEGLRTADGRLSREDELEAGIVHWTASLAADAVQESLQARAVAAHLVATVGDIQHDPQLLHRGHWWETDHAVIGPMTYDGAAYRLSETRARPGQGAPLMGEHNTYVYREVMGYSEDELTELVAAGVVY